LAFHSIDTKTINSSIALVSALTPIEPHYRDKLEAMNLHTVDDLLKRMTDPQGRRELRGNLGISDEHIRDWVTWSRLIRLKGLGVENFLLLRKVGVESIQTLARQEPSDLYEKLIRANQDHHITSRPLDVAKVKVWIRAARRQKKGERLLVD
jgi:hypothetical protein